MKRKILAAFLLTLVAIAMALTIAHFSFNEMMGTVEQLTAPNEKLVRLNNVFEEITMLDQQQRAEVIENPQKPYKYFLDQSGYLHIMIDSLKALDWDSVQMNRLNSLTEILDQRNQIFVSYMKVKAELADNREFSLQLDTLSTLLRESQRSTDSIVTTQRKTITRFIQEDSLKAVAKDRNFFKKLFSKKKDKPAANPRVRVQEELNVTVDTVAIAHQGPDLDDIQRRMREMEVDQRAQRKKLQNKELELIHTNSLFINQLLNTLHEAENEELANMRDSNARAAKVVHSGISRMHILMLCFFVAIALLVYFILIDISKSNYYRKQLEQARDHAEELTKIKQRFLANMSHEIRTPLQSIIGFSEQLKLDNKVRHDAVDAIHSSSEHLLQIVNEVLDYSRITSGNFVIAHENFRLLTIVKEVESAMRIQARRKNLTFILDTEKADEHHLSGDPFRLRQILYNLIGNAVKFTHNGFIRLAVKTEQDGQRVRCTFEVTDSGIGMTEQELKKVFHQFEQANSDITKAYGGTGLGLTIVKSLVEAQQGSLDVKSEPGSGSTFRVTLSYEMAGDELRPAETKDLPSAGHAPIRVFVVDDDPMIVRLCGLILSKNNLNHRLFHEARELLELQPDPEVTHVLIDIRMPGVNGVEVCQSLKGTYPSHTRFVALTAHVLPEERQALLTKGFDVVLAKPFHENDLLRILGVDGKARPANEPELPDFSAVRRMTMGDENLFQTILAQFLEETSADTASLEHQIREGDTISVRETVHKLAGRFGQMGIPVLSARFRDMEAGLLKGKSAKDISAELQLILSETRKLLKSISLSPAATAIRSRISPSSDTGSSGQY